MRFVLLKSALLSMVLSFGLLAPSSSAVADDSSPAGEDLPSGTVVAPTFYAEPGWDSRVSFEDAVPGIAPSTVADGGDVVALADCTPVSGRDNPHRSSTGFAVSGHGWWNKGTCDNNLARVYNCLYEWYTDGTWRRKACSTKRELRPRSAGGGRTTARRNCDNSLETSWRNHVDVDVIGEGDTAEWPYRQANVNCRYYGPDA